MKTLGLILCALASGVATYEYGFTGLLLILIAQMGLILFVESE